jgi:hypothetical protein
VLSMLSIVAYTKQFSRCLEHPTSRLDLHHFSAQKIIDNTEHQSILAVGIEEDEVVVVF